MVQNYKTSCSSKFIDIYNIIIELDTRVGISCQSEIVRYFLIFNRSHTLAPKQTLPLLLSVETKKNYFEKVLYRL